MIQLLEEKNSLTTQVTQAVSENDALRATAERLRKELTTKTRADEEFRQSRSEIASVKHELSRQKAFADERLALCTQQEVDIGHLTVLHILCSFLGFSFADPV